MSQPAEIAVNKHCAHFAQLSDTLGALLSEYSQKKAPHSLLLCGPVGVGKRTMANLLSMSLVCTAQDKPCGQCTPCRRMQRSTHGNLITLSLSDKEKTVKVDAVRAVLSQLATFPPEDGNRVVLLFDMDAFTPQAQNALLKAVEEPDDHTYFLLTAVSEQAVLPTIRSRCRVLRVPLWPAELLVNLLTDKGYSSQQAQRLAILSGGSPGKALQLDDNAEFASVKTLAESILSLKKIKDLPKVSNQLKDAKDVSEPLLNYLEQAALSPMEHDLSLAQAKRLGLTIPEIRKQSASYVNWQTLVDTLLLSVLEEN